MDPKIVKKTQDTLGKIIKKPPLTEKLLSKPPFRFLHDVMTEVIRTTGFLKGLYSADEMDSKNVTSKEAKIAFLQKVIDCVSILSGENLAVRPNKVIAGHEPENTNDLLQKIARCIRKNQSSDEAVDVVLKGKSPKSRSADQAASESTTEKRSNPDVERAKDSSDHRKRSSSRPKEKERDSARKERSSARKERDGSRKERDSEQRERDNGRRDMDREKKRDDSDRNHRDRSHHDRDHRDKDHHDRDRRDRDHRDRRHRDKKRLREEREGSRERESRSKHGEPKVVEGAPKETSEVENEEDGPPANRGPRPASAKGQRRRPHGSRSAKVDVVEEPSEGDPAIVPSKLARPPSARRAAPRIKQRNEPLEDRIDSGGHHRTAPIIVDKDSDSAHSDDDAQFVVEEERVPINEKSVDGPMSNGIHAGADSDEEHGGLVKKILETKKELEHSAAGGHDLRKHTEIERSSLSNVQQKKERELMMKEIEQLRDSVQKLCQSVTPLAKIIDYIQEDMDAMNNELNSWKTENKQHAMRLKEEESITQKSIEPLNHELQEIENNISEYRNKLAATKANILRNDEKIKKMVVAVATRS